MLKKININDDIKGFEHIVKKLRRDLHKIPEAGLLEFQTSAYIKSYLDEISIPYESAAQTGVIGYLHVNDDFETVAFRADMDGLSVTEETHFDYQSEIEGFMHACGHDGHMAIVLTLASVLKKVQDRLKYNVLFVFQPAEEGPGGASIICNEGILKKYKVKEIFGLHLYPDVPEGEFATKKGPLMAMTGEFDITITGKSGHGAIPHKALDAIIMASQLVTQFQTIVSRFISPIQPAVVTVGRLECGERRNVIAKTAILEGTFRAFETETFEIIKGKMADFCRGLETSYGCQVDLVIRDMYPAVTNDGALVDKFYALNGDNFVIKEIEPQMTAEDFADYQKEIPGLFVFLGIKNEEKGTIFPLHNSKFNFDEDVMLIGVEAFYRLVV